MYRIIELINRKNHFLEKFYSLNEDALIRFAKSDFDTLESFYQMREKILEIIRYLDQQVDETQAQFSGTPSLLDKQELRAALAIKEEYVNRILAQDLEILSCIEVAKSNIIRELQELKRNRKAVGKYKSKSMSHRIIEEA